VADKEQQDVRQMDASGYLSAPPGSGEGENGPQTSFLSYVQDQVSSGKFARDLVHD
jgi:hypothetical protein